MNIWIQKRQLDFKVGDWIYWDEVLFDVDFYNTLVLNQNGPMQILEIQLMKDKWVALVHRRGQLGSIVELRNQKKVSKDFVPSQK